MKHCRNAFSLASATGSRGRLDQGTLRCELVHNRKGNLARESLVQKSPLLVASEVREIEGREINTILSLATAIESDWLAELFPGDMQSDLQVQFDPTSKRVQAAELLRFRGLALATKRIEPPPADQAAKILADEIIAGRLPLPRLGSSRRAMAAAPALARPALPGSATACHY